MMNTGIGIPIISYCPHSKKNQQTFYNFISTHLREWPEKIKKQYERTGLLYNNNNRILQ